MRFVSYLMVFGLGAGLVSAAYAQTQPQPSTAPANTAPLADGLKMDAVKPDSNKVTSNKGGIDVSADQSLEWYQEQRIYVARGNAKAIRGAMVVEADLLTAHERDKPAAASAPDAPKTKSAEGSGDVDKMTAEGHVRITNAKTRTSGDRAVYDLDKHIMIVTGDHLRYETDKDIVTAKDSLEYYEDTKIAVARGNAKADEAQRHVEGDVLTAEFRDAPNGTTELTKLTANGHVSVITKSDVSRGDRAIYDTARNIAVISGNVRITRADGTQLTGDVGEVDFNTNQSRLLNEGGTTRVRALLPAKGGDNQSNDHSSDNHSGITNIGGRPPMDAAPATQPAPAAAVITPTAPAPAPTAPAHAAPAQAVVAPAVAPTPAPAPVQKAAAKPRKKQYPIQPVVLPVVSQPPPEPAAAAQPLDEPDYGAPAATTDANNPTAATPGPATTPYQAPVAVQPQPQPYEEPADTVPPANAYIDAEPTAGQPSAPQPTQSGDTTPSSNDQPADTTDPSSMEPNPAGAPQGQSDSP